MNRIAQPLAEVRMRGLVARTGTERTQGRRGGGVSERERLSDSQSWFTAVLPPFCVSHQNPAVCLQLQFDPFSLVSYIHTSLSEAVL